MISLILQILWKSYLKLYLHRPKCMSKITVEVCFSSLLYKKRLKSLRSSGFHLLGKEFIVWWIVNIIRTCNMQRINHKYKCWLLLNQMVLIESFLTWALYNHFVNLCTSIWIKGPMFSCLKLMISPSTCYIFSKHFFSNMFYLNNSINI